MDDVSGGIEMIGCGCEEGPEGMNAEVFPLLPPCSCFSSSSSLSFPQVPSPCHRSQGELLVDGLHSNHHHLPYDGTMNV